MTGRSRVQPDRVGVGPGARIVAELEDIPMLESGETGILPHAARRRLADARRLLYTLWYSSSTVHIHALLSGWAYDRIAQPITNVTVTITTTGGAFSGWRCGIVSPFAYCCERKAPCARLRLSVGAKTDHLAH